MIKTLPKAKKSKNSTKSKKPAMAKKLKFAKITNKVSEIDFLTFKSKTIFLYLQIAFIKVLILYHFDLKYHIRIKTNISRYTIDKILNQLTLDQKISGYVISENSNSPKSSEIGQWHLIAFFVRKMISVKAWYKFHNQELPVIIKAFKTWCHYLKGCKYEVFVLIDYNNSKQFMDVKSLSSHQIYETQKFSNYYFQIDYY